VNAFHRLMAWWWRLWAAATGIDLTTPLPRPVVPQLSYDQLVAEAEAQAAADARAAMADPWSFGRPTDPRSESFDPDYVRGLRHRCDAAVASLRSVQGQTAARVDIVRHRRDEARRLMADARTRMSELAVQDAQRRRRAFDDGEDDAEAGDRPEPEEGEDDRTPWEGDSPPLPLVWRLVILAGLVVVQLTVHYTSFLHFLGRDPGQAGSAWLLTGSTALVVVFGPFIAGTVLRARAATGSDPRIGYAILGVTLAWLCVAAAMSWIRARVFQAGAAQPDDAHVTYATIVVMFLALSALVGSTALMLGLARRHPYQGAYVRNQARGDRYAMVMHAAATHINPAYLDPSQSEVTLEDQERAIRVSYAAAENAYFAALVRAYGDPAFTEAIQHRRGLGGAET